MRYCYHIAMDTITKQEIIIIEFLFLKSNFD